MFHGPLGPCFAVARQAWLPSFTPAGRLVQRPDNGPGQQGAGSFPPPAFRSGYSTSIWQGKRFVKGAFAAVSHNMAMPPLTCKVVPVT